MYIIVQVVLPTNKAQLRGIATTHAITMPHTVITPDQCSQQNHTPCNAHANYQEPENADHLCSDKIDHVFVCLIIFMSFGDEWMAKSFVGCNTLHRIAFKQAIQK